MLSVYIAMVCILYCVEQVSNSFLHKNAVFVLPETLDVHDILALKMSHASTVIMNDRQKPQNFQNKLNTQQRCVNFVNHLDRIWVLAILCPVKSKVVCIKGMIGLGYVMVDLAGGGVPRQGRPSSVKMCSSSLDPKRWCKTSTG